MDGLGFDISDPSTAVTTPNIVLLVAWVILAAIAAIAAPEGRKTIFFVCTLLLLGPLGVHAALVANPRADYYYDD
jgi:hypothetical protein